MFVRRKAADAPVEIDVSARRKTAEMQRSQGACGRQIAAANQTSHRIKVGKIRGVETLPASLQRGIADRARHLRGIDPRRHRWECRAGSAHAPAGAHTIRPAAVESGPAPPPSIVHDCSHVAAGSDGLSLNGGDRPPSMIRSDASRAASSTATCRLTYARCGTASWIETPASRHTHHEASCIRCERRTRTIDIRAGREPGSHRCMASSGAAACANHETSLASCPRSTRRSVWETRSRARS